MSRQPAGRRERRAASDEQMKGTGIFSRGRCEPWGDRYGAVCRNRKPPGLSTRRASCRYAAGSATCSITAWTARDRTSRSERAGWCRRRGRTDVAHAFFRARRTPASRKRSAGSMADNRRRLFGERHTHPAAAAAVVQHAAERDGRRRARDSPAPSRCASIRRPRSGTRTESGRRRARLMARSSTTLNAPCPARRRPSRGTRPVARWRLRAARASGHRDCSYTPNRRPYRAPGRRPGEDAARSTRAQPGRGHPGQLDESS